MAPRDVALLVGVAMLWGFNFVPIRWALDAVPPFALAATRFTFAALPMVFLVRRPQGPVRLVVAYGLGLRDLEPAAAPLHRRGGHAVRPAGADCRPGQ